MRVAAMTPSDLLPFARAGDHPLGVDGFAEAVARMWRTGQSRPEWCFVVEDGGAPLGRVGYSLSDMTPHEIGMFGLALPWAGDFRGPGLALLKDSLKAMRRYGPTHLERRLESSWEHAAQERALLEEAGFPLVQEKVTLTRRGGPPVTVPSRLAFRTMAQAGEKAMIGAIQRVTQGTLDRVDRIERGIMGARGHAAAYFAILKRVDDQPEWWLLGYAGDALAGLVIPQRFAGDLGAINYIGVLPGLRGQGYGGDLVLKATALLEAAGIGEVIADVDVTNAPMLRAFERAGYARQPATQYVYLGEIRRAVV